MIDLKKNRYHRYWNRYHKYKDEKLPRKLKKYFLGVRLGKQNIKRLIKEYKKGDSGFCPKCGCDISESSGQMASYPETYINYFCARCGFMVAIEDNSPCVHVLEYGGIWF